MKLLVFSGWKNKPRRQFLNLTATRFPDKAGLSGWVPLIESSMSSTRFPRFSLPLIFTAAGLLIKEGRGILAAAFFT